ncbi:MAG: Brp/Blh family beta-carotene 15,15'-dioxygenase [Verrucomicrobiota bacterium]
MVAILTGLAFPQIIESAQYLPFLLSVVVLGMTHGAADFALIRKRHASNRASQALWFSTYALILIASLGLIYASPPLGLLAFAVFSIWHFGSSDIKDLTTETQVIPAKSAYAIRSLFRGSLIVLSPLIFHPASVESIFNEWIGLSGGIPLAPSLWADFRFVSLIVISVLGTFTVGFHLSSLQTAKHRRLFSIETGENILLLVASSILTPLFFVGLYFIGWHSIRHTHHVDHRLLGERKPKRSSFFAPFGRVLARSIPLLVPALLLLGLLLVTNPWNQVWTIDRVVALILIFYAVVTPPHEFIVSNLFRPRLKNAGNQSRDLARRSSHKPENERPAPVI